jgi:hypothetical protein
MTSHADGELVITFRPDATPEEEERFLAELAHALLAIARHVVAVQEEPAGKEIKGAEA